MYSWLTDRSVVKENIKGEAKLEPYDADKSKITNLIDALWRDCPIALDPPCWIDGRSQPDPANLIAFPNGLFDVNNYLYDGSVVLHPIDPLYFTFSTLPYNYDAGATCPQWFKFLSQIFPHEPAKIQLLQEWFGYNLVPDVSQQKFMLWLGKAGSGKSTTLHVLASMLGQHHVAWTSLDQLSERFGITQLIGKSAALVPDGHIGRFTDTSMLIERLKVLTGENGGKMAVRKMREDADEARFFARVTIAANEPPELPDEANALRRRTLALLFTEEFVRNPDRGLPDRLALEAPGVFNWALEGLVRLRQRGEFTIPDSSTQLADDLSRVSSPLRAFVHNCCEVSADHVILADQFLDAWRNWVRINGGSAGMSMKVIYVLCSTFMGIKQRLDVKNGQKYLYLHGIGLTQDAKEKYLK
jgi:putative DNA primase/helicase